MTNGVDNLRIWTLYNFVFSVGLTADDISIEQ